MIRTRHLSNNESIYIAGIYADISALKAVDITSATDYPNNIWAYVEGIGEYYLQRGLTSEVESLPNLIIATTGEGRWYKKELTVASGNSLLKRMALGGSGGSSGGGMGSNFLFFNTGYGIDVNASVGSDVLNIGTSNADTINIGYSGSTINILGSLLYENVTNLTVNDKLITLNKGGASASAVSTGFEIEEAGVITGWITTNGTRNGFELKSPAVAYKETLDLSLLTADRALQVPNESGVIATRAWTTTQLADYIPLAGGSQGDVLQIQSGTVVRSAALIDAAGVLSVWLNPRYLYDGVGNLSINWGGRVMKDSSNEDSIDWDSRVLKDSAHHNAVHWDGRILSTNAGFASVDWENYQLKVNGGFLMLDWAYNLLKTERSGAPFKCVDWRNGILYDASEVIAANWNDRTLKASSGNVTADWAVGGAVKLYNSAGTFYNALTSAPTVNRTITIPDVTGTLITTGDTGTVTNTMINSLAWSKITGAPTTISGFGITDAVTLTGAETLVGKTLINPVIGAIVNSGTLTLPTSTDTLVGRSTTDTLTNKTLTSPVISTIVNTGTLTLPTATDTLVGRTTTDTLTNKTLTAPTINGGTHTAITNLALRDTSAAFDVTLAATSSSTLSAGRTLTLDVVNASRTLKLGGNLTTAADFITSGANSLTLTTTGSTNVTLPTSGTLAVLGSPTFTGTPAAPTASAGTNTTQIATTAFVTAINNNAAYRTLLEVSGSHTAGKVAGTYAFGHGDPLAVSGTGTLYPIATIYIAGADFPTINGITTKLRIRAQLYTNDVAPTGNFTFGLYPITRPAASGTTGVCTFTLGTVVSGSNGASFTTPAADGLLNAASSDFTIPSDGHYVIGIVTTATVATNAHMHVTAQLQMRNA